MAIDYKTFSGGGQDTGNVFIKKWWACDKSDRADAVAGIVKIITEYDDKRRAQYQTSVKMYGNTNLTGVNGISYAKTGVRQSTIKDRVTYNVVQAGIDTLVSKMSKNRPKPLFLTSGGNYKMQRKAKKLDKFVDGVFYENEAHNLGSFCFRDSCIFGDGFIHVFEQADRVKYERVIPTELYVDWVEAFYGEPRQMHRVKNVDREVMLDTYPEHRDMILRADAAIADISGQADNVVDQITVVESWHLPSGKDATDGIHTINIDSGNIFEEKWTKDYFPIARLSWCKRLYGYWSQGAAEQGQSIQLEINKILWIIQRSMHLAGSFKILVKNGSKVPKEHLNNDLGTIVTYNDVPPQYITPPVVPMEFYQHLNNLENKYFAQLGISQLSVASEKPAGLNSGKALREYNDIETERFMSIGQAYERLYLDLAKMTIDCAKSIYTRTGDYKVKVPQKGFIETINWKDVDLKEDQYVMKIFPVSSLPSDPAGRLQTVQEYAQAGFIDPLTAKKLLDFPDLEQVDNLSNSQEDWITKTLDAIVDDGDYSPPEPEMKLDLAKTLILQYIAFGSANGLEDNKLSMLRTWNTQVAVLMAKGMPPMPINGGAPQPLGLAQPQQQSDLIQNTPQQAVA